MKTQNFGRSRITRSRPTSLYLPRPLALRTLGLALKSYRESRENGEPIDKPKNPFPSAGFEKLDIKSTGTQSGKWPDSQGRYWWKLTLQDGSINNDFYWMEDKVRGYPDKSNNERYWFTVGHANGTKMEGFSEEPDYQKGFPDKDGKYWRYIQFTDTHCPAIRQWMEEKDRNYMARTKREEEAKSRLVQQQQSPVYSSQQQTYQPQPQVYPQQQQAYPLQPQAYPSQQQTYAPYQQAYPLQPQAYPPQPQAYPQQQQAYPRQAYPPQQRAYYPPQQQTYPPQQPQLQQYPQQREKELELEIARLQQLVIQQQSPVRPATSDVSTREGKQKVTGQPSLNEETIKQLALSIQYEEIKIVQKLGEGAFGIVSYGQWRYEEVAIKKLHLQQMSDNALIEFKEEAAVMARLRSEYIVSLRGICLTPYGLVMEYMRGGSLFNLLHSQASLPWSIRQRIALDVAKGLAFLHSHQPLILHRDLKSQNVLLNEYQRAKLADFGLAKVRVESSRSQTYAQSSGKSVGTIPWMAPECFGIRPKYSDKSDMYAYGMVLWELSSRKLPYEEVTDPDEIRAAVKDGEREEIPHETTNPKEPVPASIKSFIQLCWFGAPDKRPTAKEAIETLEQATPSQSSAPQSTSSSSSGYPSGFMSNLSSFK